MQRFGSGLVIVGLLALAVGVLGLLSLLLQWMGVAFVFPVTPWYGPLLGGLVLIVVGGLMRRPSASAAG